LLPTAEPMRADEIDSSFAPMGHPSVASVELEGEAVLLEESTGTFHLLNSTATTVWSGFDGSTTIEDLATHLAYVFDADLHQVRRDVLSLTRELGKRGLLQGVAAEDGKIAPLPIPDLPPERFFELVHENRALLTPFYEDYVDSVSRFEMAVSLELATFLLVLCRVTEPETVLDLGSGFSSLVFRLYAQDASQRVGIWSVDHSAEWLDKTRSFLTRHGYPTDRLLTWASFIKDKPRGGFDLILHDLGGGIKLRKQMLETVVDLANPGGSVVLDDIGASDYKAHVQRFLEKRPFRSWSLEKYTRDKAGRYAMLLIRESSA
jgi:predicted O-methyltransferase YrrM